MKVYKLILVVLLSWVATAGTPLMAQSQTETTSTTATTSGPEMADVMRQDGKIYIVVAVLVTVLLGILFYLISLDRKVAKLERELRQ
ncbi:CcmD family protein [Nibribacter koreensis]|uniref:CcmD family protein n=1 Tax=Nibribacter koreensis TaxID=1084519 RepID=A0ABP8FXF5_9BACT